MYLTVEDTPFSDTYIICVSAYLAIPTSSHLSIWPSVYVVRTRLSLVCDLLHSSGEDLDSSVHLLLGNDEGRDESNGIET